MEEQQQQIASIATQLALLSQAIDSLRLDLAEFNGTISQKLKEQGHELRLLQDEHLQRCGAITRIEKWMNETDMRITEIQKMADKFSQTGLRLEKTETRLDKIEELVPALKIVLWVGALLGTSIVALVWAFITGQARLVFP